MGRPLRSIDESDAWAAPRLRVKRGSHVHNTGTIARCYWTKGQCGEPALRRGAAERLRAPAATRLSARRFSKERMEGKRLCRSKKAPPGDGASRGTALNLVESGKGGPA